MSFGQGQITDWTIRFESNPVAAPYGVGPQGIANRNDTASVKFSGASTIVVTGTMNITGGVSFTTTETRTAGASTAAAGSTNADAAALPLGTASVYPTTAADDTKGVILTASDKVTGRMIFIGNGVSNKILKIYPAAGGTINGAAADAAFSTASGKGAILYCLNATANTWLAW